MSTANEIMVDIPIVYINGAAPDYFMIDIDQRGLPVWHRTDSGSVGLIDGTSLSFRRCSRINDAVFRFVLL